MIYKSVIYKKESIKNSIRKTRNEVKMFYPVNVLTEKDTPIGTALFTEHEINKALIRGSKNKEDVSKLKFLDETNKYIMIGVLIGMGMFSIVWYIVHILLN